MLTKKQLLDAIKHSPDDAIVTILGTGDIVHITNNGNILLSSQKPISHCTECEGYIYTINHNTLKDNHADTFAVYCPNCNKIIHSKT